MDNMRTNFIICLILFAMFIWFIANGSILSTLSFAVSIFYVVENMILRHRSKKNAELLSQLKSDELEELRKRREFNEE